MKRLAILGVLAFSMLYVAGCKPQPAKPGQATVLLNVTSDAEASPQSVDMAMKLAGFSLAEKRKVVMFFNVKGVKMPTKDFGDDFAFESNKPLKVQLSKLIDDGVEVHVCPICMKALGVEKGDLLEGAQETTRDKLFAHIGADTAVFTY